ncbi:MAG TPA: ribosome maturation factor RimP [bacterium]|nr:ribosome maturation factor RimP [bacterium]
MGYTRFFCFMHENLIKDVENIIEEILLYYGCYLVGVVFLPAVEDNGVILRVYIDSDGGIKVSQLSDVSKKLSMILDIEDMIKFKYILEVSSPGINRVLLKFEDYEKYKGERVKILLKNEIDGRLDLVGRIMDTENTGIDSGGAKIKILDEVESKDRIIPFFKIVKGNLLVV